jgi:small subunit ribosomal protein S8e
MGIWHGEKGRKSTGGKIKIGRKKRKREMGSLPLHTLVGKEQREVVKTKGGGIKVKAAKVEFVNVLNPADKTVKKVKILDIVSNVANPHFVRRGILTKGSIIKTEIGNARVTSRPSQHGIVNAIIVEEKK